MMILIMILIKILFMTDVTSSTSNGSKTLIDLACFNDMDTEFKRSQMPSFWKKKKNKNKRKKKRERNLLH